MLTRFLIFFSGKYHQFDNIVLPQERSRYERLKSFLGFSSTTHDGMQKKCLEMYLTNHRKMICDGELSPSQLNIPQAANGVVRIFRQLYTQNICQHFSSYTWISEQLPKVYQTVLYTYTMICHCYNVMYVGIIGNGWVDTFSY